MIDQRGNSNDVKLTKTSLFTIILHLIVIVLS